jgi:hypothetical protein
LPAEQSQVVLAPDHRSARFGYVQVTINWQRMDKIDLLTMLGNTQGYLGQPLLGSLYENLLSQASKEDGVKPC